MSQLNSNFLFLAILVPFGLTIVEAQLYTLEVLAVYLWVSFPTGTLPCSSHDGE